MPTADANGPSGLSLEGAGWEALFPARQVGGPLAVSVAGAPLFGQVSTRLGDLTDDLALSKGPRELRKHHSRQVSAEGRWPFGAGIVIRQTSRFGPAIMRQTSDLQLPRGTVLRGAVRLGALRLPASMTRWRELRATASGGLTLGPWQTLTALPATGQVWTPPPLAIILERHDGVLLELGGGYDLWRWDRGLDLPGQPLRWSLTPADDGWHFARHLADLAEPAEPPPVPRRLCWYAAWHDPARLAPTSQPAGDPVILTWRGDATELDPASLRQPGVTPTTPVLLDLALAAWPASTRRLAPTPASGDPPAPPCLAATPVRNRLHRALRQLAAWAAETGWEGELLVRGADPGLCLAGQHLDKHGERRHWDLDDLHDLWDWAANTLGGRRPRFVPAPTTPMTPALLALNHGD